jgi:hypothetical protein
MKRNLALLLLSVSLASCWGHLGFDCCARLAVGKFARSVRQAMQWHGLSSLVIALGVLIRLALLL